MTALAAEATTAHRDERIARTILFSCAVVFVIGIVLILAYLLYAGTKLFFHDGLSPLTFLFSSDWSIDDPSAKDVRANHFGAGPFIVGSLVATGFAILIGGPLGVAIGVFFSELAPPKVAAVFKPAIEVLVGIPSVVYGWLGLTLLVPLIGNVFHLQDGDGLLAAGIVLSIMIVPTVISLSEDALRVVPNALREGSLALGATRWETISKVLIPAASSGIAVAVILGIARAIGETLALQLVIGNATVIPTSLLKPAAALTSEIVMDMQNAQDGTPFQDSLFSMALLLLLISMGLILAIRFALRKRA